MRRYELSKDQYELIEDLLPFNGKPRNIIHKYKILFANY
jgi:hypothetical protein